MIPKFLTFTLLVTIGFGSVQNEEQMSYSLWPRQNHMLEMKVLKATFDKDSMPMEDIDEMSSDEVSDSQTHNQMIEQQMATNRVKREADAEVSPNSAATNEPPKTTTKRQTAITGNANRFQNLVNLPVQLNVLANVLSKLNTGILDTKSTPPISNSISGNDNTVSSLVNVPVNADAVVNILSSVNKSPDTGSVQGGLVDGVLGGLLGGAGASGDPVSSLLGGSDNGGLLGGLLGNTLGDLLKALLGSEALVGKLMGGQDGPAFLGGLLNNLLAGVSQLVDNLLQLLVGLLNALTHSVPGMKSASTAAGASLPTAADAAQHLNVPGNNDQVKSLVNAPVRINALINVLTSLKQQLHEAMNPSAVSAATGQGTGGSGGGLLGNLLGPSSPSSKGSTGSSAASAGGLLGSILGSTDDSGAAAGKTSLLGNNNVVSSLLNVAPDVNLNLNLLSEVTDLLKAGSSGDSPGGVFQGTKPNEYCFDIPLNQADTSITGSNNTISNAINVQPKINLDLNLLSSVKQTGQSKVATQRVCITLPSKNAPTKPEKNPAKTPPITLTPRPPMAPTVKPSSPSRAAYSPSPASPNGEICFYVWVDQSGTVVNGNNNQMNSLLNLPLNLNLDLNLLSNVQPTGLNPPPNLVMRRVCMPGNFAATPAAVQPVVENPRCFRRTCAKWRHYVDYNCANKPNEYPMYTIAKDVY